MQIRKARKEDVPGIAQLINEGLKKGFFTRTGTRKPWTKEKIKRITKDINKKYDQAYIAIDNKIIGSASYSGSPRGRLRHRVSCGWSVHPDYTRQGIGKKLLTKVLAEAKKQGFKRAEAEVAADNQASKKLAESCGMKLEGRKKAGLLLDNGKYADTLIYGKVF